MYSPSTFRRNAMTCGPCADGLVSSKWRWERRPLPSRPTCISSSNSSRSSGPRSRARRHGLLEVCAGHGQGFARDGLAKLLDGALVGLGGLFILYTKLYPAAKGREAAIGIDAEEALPAS